MRLSVIKRMSSSFSRAVELLPPSLNWVDNDYYVGSGKGLDVVNKATGSVVMTSASASDVDVDIAVQSALAAFQTFRDIPAAERGQLLLKAATLLEERTIEFAHLETLDTGKPFYESEMDVGTGVDALRFIGGLVQNYHGNHFDLGGNFAYTSREPLGVIGGIGPWNYPLQTACWKIAPALACGNSLVYKCSEYTPLSTVAFAALLKEAGLPAGVVNIVAGEGSVGAAITAHPNISKLSFTGSVPTGKRIMSKASDSLKNVTLELGGKSPLIIFDDVDMKNAVSTAMLANFFSQGAVCSNGTRVFVQRSILEEFTSQLVERTKKLKIGNPMQKDVKVGATICKMQYDKILKYLDIAREEGCEVLCGGGAVSLDDPDLAGGFYIAPTVLGNCTDDMTVVKEEVFGPVLSILVFDTEEEVIRRANDTPFGLAAGVCTQNLSRAYRVTSKLEAGSCNINTFNNFPTVIPFGGYKNSGIGRELGEECLNYYSQTKSVYVETGDPWCPFE